VRPPNGLRSSSLPNERELRLKTDLPVVLSRLRLLPAGGCVIMVLTLLIWFFLCALVGAVATSRGRSGFGWFLFSCVLSPLLGGIVVLLLTNLRSERIAQFRHEQLLRVLAARSGEQPLEAAMASELMGPEVQDYSPARPQIGFGAFVTFIICGAIILLALFNH
jgi:uncharacterized membrane protein YhdT